LFWLEGEKDGRQRSGFKGEKMSECGGGEGGGGGRNVGKVNDGWERWRKRKKEMSPWRSLRAH